MLRFLPLLILLPCLVALSLLPHPTSSVAASDSRSPGFFADPHDASRHQHPLPANPAAAGNRRPAIGPERIAVIGAGPGGSSFTYYASRAFPHAQIDVYEAKSRAGGRCFSERLVVSERLGLSILVESGASIFVEENQNLVRAARAFGLTIGDDDDRLLAAHLGGRHAATDPQTNGSNSTAASNMQVSIWNGTHTLFSLDLSGGWRSKFRGFWRYGFGPRTTGRLADAAAAKMGRVYTPGHQSYLSMEALVDGLGLREETKVTMGNYVEAQGINRRWADEVIEGVTRVNYGRGLNQVHALAALVGFVKGPTYNVREGNQRLYEQFLSRSKARPYFNSTVTAIVPLARSSTSPGGYQLSFTHSSTGLATNSSRVYDTVVLALPPTATGLGQIALPPSSSPIPAIPYHHIHVTFVLGKLNLATFPTRPVQVLTTRAVRDVQSLSLVWDFGYQLADYGVGLYKVFSTMALTTAEGGTRMRQLFSRVDKVWERQWLSYPVMQPEHGDKFYPPLKVHEMPPEGARTRPARMYYLNGMERFVSTMETATVASRNLVRVLVDEILGENRAEDVERDRQGSE